MQTDTALVQPLHHNSSLRSHNESILLLVRSAAHKLVPDLAKPASRRYLRFAVAPLVNIYVSVQSMATLLRAGEVHRSCWGEGSLTSRHNCPCCMGSQRMLTSKHHMIWPGFLINKHTVCSTPDAFGPRQFWLVVSSVY